MTRRVAVTRIGVVSALDRTRDRFRNDLMAGCGAIRSMIVMPEGSVRFPNGTEVPDYHAADYFDQKEAGLLDGKMTKTRRNQHTCFDDDISKPKETHEMTKS